MSKFTKSLLAIIMVLCLVIGFAACSAKKNQIEYIEVTDINGEVVTDADGNPVTERVDLDGEEQGGENVTVEHQNQGGSSGGNSGGNSDSGNNQGGGDNGGNNGGNNGGGSEDPTETTEPVTEKPKKRDFSVTIKMPYKNDEASTLVIAYRVAGETEYTKLDPQEVKLDGEEHTFDIDSAKGAVSIIIGLTGVDIAPGTDRGVMSAQEDNLLLSPKIGIEIADGGWD